MKRRYVVALLMLYAVLLAPWTWSQTGTAAISGVVTDPSGALLPGTAVTVSNVQTGVTRTVHSNDAGLYIVAGLPPGEYEVRASRDGFQPLLRKGINLNVDQQSRQDVTMALGTATKQVDVTASIEQYLEPDTSALHQVITSALVLDLPLNGRNLNQLISLNTGVATTTASFFKNVGVDLAINGQRSSTSGFLIDGLDNVEFMGQSPNITLQPDAVREFNVMTNSFSAEYGRSTAGVIDIATRSGTNNLHGSAFEFVRNDIFDANDYFSNRTGSKKLPFRFNQFGGTIGGPIKQNKLFYFLGYQGTLIRTHYTGILSVPPDAWRTGDFSSLLAQGIQLYDPTTVTGAIGVFPQRAPFVNNQIPLAKQDPAARKLLALYPSPNRPGNFNNFVEPLGASTSDHQGNAKVDYQATSKDNISGRWNIENSDLENQPFFGDSGGGGPLPVNQFKSQDAGVIHNHTFSPTFLNTAGYGYLRRTVNNLPSGFGQPLNQQVGIPGISSDPTASGLAFIQPNGFTQLGGQVFFPQIITIQSHQLKDNMIWAHGRHIVKAGFDYRRRLLHLYQAGFPRGFFVFDNLPTAQAGAGGNPVASLLTGYYLFGQRDVLDHFNNQTGNEFSGYFEDNIHVNKRLTLNLGLRYDVFKPQVEDKNRQANFDMATKTMLLAGVNGNSRSLVDTDWGDLGPRVGFAFSPFSDNKTVFRGGYGIYYFAEQNALATLDRLTYNIPFYFLQTFLQVGLFTPTRRISDGLPTPPPLDPTKPFGKVGYRVPGLGDSMVQSWNFDVQHEIMRDTLLDIAYAGSKGTNLLALRNPNQPAPGAVQVFPVSPSIGLLFTMTNQGFSNYNSLQVKVNRRVTSGLTFLASYTWSKSIDNSPGYWPNSGMSQLPQDSLNPNQGEVGLSDWDIRHNFILSYNWQIPVGRGRRYMSHGNSFLEGVLGGWQMTGIVAFRGGTPFTPYISSNRANTANGGALRPNRIGSGVSSDPTVDHWFDKTQFALPAVFTYGNSSRNILIGPGLKNADIGLYKNFKVYERIQLQFRAEFFNITNTPHFGLPNPFIDTPAGGTINGLATPPRQIQFGLKLNF
jgi:Carboxypeptidase regulatory-like domain/TonB dependent receptor